MSAIRWNGGAGPAIRLAAVSSLVGPKGDTGDFVEVGISTIGSGHDTRVLRNNNGVLDEYEVAGTGKVAMTTWAQARSFAAAGDFDGLNGDGSDVASVLDAALQQLSDVSPGNKLFLPAGNYLLGERVTLRSSIDLEGVGRGKSNLIIPNIADYALFGQALENVTVSGFTMEMGNYGGANTSAVAFSDCDNVSIINNEIKNQGTFSLVLNGCRNSQIIGNKITEDNPVTSQNQGILVSLSAGPNPNITIRDNHLIGTAMNIGLSRSSIENNTIEGWSFGSGITTELHEDCFELSIRGNKISGGRGLDTNDTWAIGIENWAPDTIIEDNLCTDNDGYGIISGAPNCRISNNTCRDNGHGQNGHGIGVSFQAHNTQIGGNRCYNTLGASGDQGYGLEIGSGLTGIVVEPNNFEGNKTGTILAFSAFKEVFPVPFAVPPRHVWIGQDGIFELAPSFRALVVADLPSEAFGFSVPTNLKLAASVSSNALTVSVKNSAGNDPSNSDPVKVPFRDPTVANGGLIWRSLTDALSLTISSGSTLGASNNVAFRAWIVLFDDTGTLRLGVINCSTSSRIYPLDECGVASSTAEGGVGAADSAGVIYTGTAVSSKASRIIGYLEYDSGLATAGTYASAPTKLQLFGPGVKKPGDVVQVSYGETSATVTHVDTAASDTGITCDITPTSKINIMKIDGVIQSIFPSEMGLGLIARLNRSGSNIKTLGSTIGFGAGARVIAPSAFLALDKPQSVSTLTYKVTGQAGNNTGTVNTQHDGSGGCLSTISVAELMG